MSPLRSLAALASNLARLAAVALPLIATLPFPAAGADIVTGPGAGGAPQVRRFDSVTGLQVSAFQAFDPAFTGGVYVAMGDVTGDQMPDAVVGAGPGSAPQVKVFDGVTGLEVRSFLAYDPAFTGGVRVAVGDVTGDGQADIVTGAGPGGQPHVKVFDGATGLEIRSFLAYDPGFAGGVYVAAGDVTGDGLADLVTGKGEGGLPHVRVFDGVSSLEVMSFLAYDPSFTTGVRVAAGDVNGDGRADIVTGAATGTGPNLGSGNQSFPDVTVIDGATGMRLRAVLAFPASPTGGVNVAVGDLNGDGRAEVLAGAGAGSVPLVRVFDGATGGQVLAFMAYDLAFLGGVRVAAAVTLGAVTFTSAAETTFTMGDPGTFEVTTSGLPAPALTQGGDPLPAGVMFTDNGDGTGTLEGTPGPGTEGTYALTFTADNGVGPAVVQNFTLTVAAVGSVTALVATPNPSVFGQQVTLTATVTPATPDPATATGDVTFKDGATVLGTATLDALGQATLQTTALALGARTLTAEYPGDGHFGPSTSAPVTQTVNPADTTTNVVSSANPSVFGQPVTFTATVTPVAPGGGVPTGTVTFTVDGVPQGPVTLDGAGQATLTTSTLTVGPHPISATYTPATGDYTASTSPTLTQTVNQAATTTVVVSSTNPSVFGQPVTFTATVSAQAPATGTPTGTVTFVVDANPVATVTLNGAGQASFTTSALAVGGHSVSATYNGGGNFTGSTSPTLTQTVNQAATTTAVVGAPTPSVFGQTVTFTATVTAAPPGAGTPAGSVTFRDGTTVLGTVALNGAAQATLMTAALAAGLHAITAEYLGNPSFTGSTSPIFTQTVSPAATATAVVGAPNPSVFGEQVTFTATVTVTPPGAGTPAGLVTFRDGATVLGSVSLDMSGQATLTTAALATGLRSITAEYGGSASFTGSTSAIFTQTVNPASTTTVLMSSPNPSGFQESVTFTATVTVVAPGGGTPAGTVSFRDGGVEIGTGVLAGGVATFATSLLTVGSHNITAVYLGSPSHATSTSAVVVQVVQIVANPDAYAATGNIAITVAAPGVLGNDSNGGVGLTVLAPGTSATSGGGSVTLNANGSFTYDPPAGLTGGATDTFTYQATDGVGTSNVATVTITLTDILWFVCDACGGTNLGTLLNPFTSVGAFSAVNTGAPPAPQPNDKLYIRTGTYDAAADTLALRDGQQVWGQGVAASTVITPAPNTHASFAALTAGARPLLAPTSGNGVTLAQNNALRHFDVGAVAAIKISGSSFGTLTASNMILSGAGQALVLATGTLAATLDSVTSSSGGTNILLTGVAGALTMGGGALSGATGRAVDIDGGTASVTYTGTIANSGTGIRVANKTGGTVVFAGSTKTLSTGANPAVTISGNNAATTITFSNGGLDIDTTSGAGFNATGGGTVNVSGSGNTVTTTSGTAVTIVNVTIGVSGITLQSVSHNGNNTAIVLNNTGAGTFTVTGTGTTPGSGGTIENIVGSDAITLNTTGGLVTLQNMIIEDISAANDATAAQNTRSGVDAISGVNVNGGLTLDGTTIRRISDNAIFGGTSGIPDVATVWNGLTIRNSTIEDTNRFHVPSKGDANNEGTVRILGIRGTVDITNSLFQRGAEFLDFFVTAGTLTMTVTNSQFLNAYKEFVAADNSPLASVGNHGIDVTVQGSANATVTIGDRNNAALGNDFLNGRLASVRVGNDAGATGAVSVVLGNNTFQSDDHSSGVFCNPGCVSADFDFPQAGVLLFSLGTTSSTFDAIVDGNLFDEATNASGGVGQLTLAMTRSVWQALVTNNTFRIPGNAPWFIRADGTTTTAKVRFLNNTGIQGFFECPDASCEDGINPPGGYIGPGLRALADTQNGGNLDLTIDGDDFAEHDAGFDPGQTFEARAGVNLTGSSSLCVSLLNNTAPDGYSLEQFNGSQTVNVFTAGGAGTCTAPGSPGNCQNALNANNNTGGGGNPATDPPFVNVVGTVNVVAAACQVPNLP